MIDFSIFLFFILYRQILFFFRKYTLDELLTNVMIYWISGNIAASLRFYKENFTFDDKFYALDM